MQITVNGIATEVHAGESLLDIVRRLGLDTESLKTRPIAADIAGEVFTLNYIPMREKEQRGDNPTTFRMRKAIRKGGGEVKLIRYEESRGRAIYERTIIYIFFLAMRELFPQTHCKVNYAIGPSIDISVDLEPQFTPDDVETVRGKMREIVEADYPLTRKRLDIDEAIELFERDGQADKVRLLKWRQFTYFDVYQHGDYADYF